MVSVSVCAFPADQTKSVTFQPSHPRIVKQAVQEEMKCSHDGGGLYVMLWYQQTANSLMHLIGFNYKDSTYKKQFEGRFQITDH